MRMSEYGANIHSIPKSSTPPFQIISQLSSSGSAPNTSSETEEYSAPKDTSTDMDNPSPTQAEIHSTFSTQEEDFQTRVSISSSYSHDLPEHIPDWNYTDLLIQQLHLDSEQQRDSYHSSEEDYVISPHPLDSPSPGGSPPSGRASSVLLNTIPELQEESIQPQYQISIQTQNLNAVYTAASTSPTTARNSAFTSRNPTRSNSLQYPSTQSTAPSSIHSPDPPTLSHQKSSASSSTPSQHTAFMPSHQHTLKVSSTTATTTTTHSGPKYEFQVAKEKEERQAREWAHRYDEAQLGGRALSVNDLDYQRLTSQFRQERYTRELARISESRTRNLHEQEMRRLNQTMVRTGDAEGDASYGGNNFVDDGGVMMNSNAPFVEEKRSKRRRLLGFLGAKK